MILNAMIPSSNMAASFGSSTKFYSMTKPNEGTFMFGFVDRLVGLDEDSRALALHCDGGVVVEDVASFCEVTVPPHLQMSLAS